jgi:hypothetical protein
MRLHNPNIYVIVIFWFHADRPDHSRAYSDETQESYVRTRGCEMLTLFTSVGTLWREMILTDIWPDSHLWGAHAWTEIFFGRRL